MIVFEWDDAKAESNFRKHGVRFEDAVQVFEDSYHFGEQDRFVDGEARWRTTGIDAGLVLLVVAHLTFDDEDLEVVRIISARPATSKERILYGKNREKNFS